MKKQRAYVRVVSGDLRIGGRCVVEIPDGTQLNISRIIGLDNDTIETKNTIYVKYVPGQDPQYHPQAQPYAYQNPNNPYQSPAQPIESPYVSQTPTNPYPSPQPYQQPMINEDDEYDNPTLYPNVQPQRYENQPAPAYSTSKSPLVRYSDQLRQAGEDAYTERINNAKKLKIIGDIDSPNKHNDENQ